MRRFSTTLALSLAPALIACAEETRAAALPEQEAPTPCEVCAGTAGKHRSFQDFAPWVAEGTVDPELMLLFAIEHAPVHVTEFCPRIFGTLPEQGTASVYTLEVEAAPHRYARTWLVIGSDPWVSTASDEREIILYDMRFHTQGWGRHTWLLMMEVDRKPRTAEEDVTRVRWTVQNDRGTVWEQGEYVGLTPVGVPLADLVYAGDADLTMSVPGRVLLAEVDGNVYSLRLEEKDFETLGQEWRQSWTLELEKAIEEDRQIPVWNEEDS
jgi:hypothetical protein